jgi:hypothetical protein
VRPSGHLSAAIAFTSILSEQFIVAIVSALIRNPRPAPQRLTAILVANVPNV